MKKQFLMLAAVAAIAFTSCKDEKAADKVNEENVSEVAERDANAEGTPKMVFAEEMHDFGTINEGDVVEHTFKFTNTGDAPLVITNAKGSCGCTVPSWPKEAIAPGAEGEMIVKFNSRNKPNNQMKTVRITTNTASGQEMIKIQAFVNPAAAADGAAAPAAESHEGHSHS